MVIIIARLVGPRLYGSFALAISTWLILQGVVRAALIQPYVVESSRQGRSSFRMSTRRASGAVVAIGVLGGIVMAAIGILLGPRTTEGSAFVTLGVLAPFLVLQDFWRFAAFARMRAPAALFNDATWAVVQAAGLVVLAHAAHKTSALAMGAWGAGGGAGALVGMLQFRLRPSLSHASLAWLRRISRWGTWFGISNGVYAAANQVVAVILVASAGPAALGGLRAIQTLYGPAQLVAASGDSVALPAGSRQYDAGGYSRLTSFLALYGGVLGALLGLYGILLWIVRTPVVHLVLGSRFLQYDKLMLPLSLGLLATAASYSGGLGLRAVLAGRQLAAAETAAAVVQIVTISILLHLYGLIGVAWGILITSLFHSTAVWCTYRVVRRRGDRRVVEAEQAEVVGA
jgi:O-antigen/teichoic acid export membrane protein